jgi:hypothetical protein
MDDSQVTQEKPATGKKVLFFGFQFLLLLGVAANGFLLKILLDRVRMHDDTIRMMDEKITPLSREFQTLTSQSNDMMDKLKTMGAYKTVDGVENNDPDLWKKPQNWSRIKVGLTDDEVQSILGKPSSRQYVSEISEAFYYEGFVKEYGDLTSKILMDGGKVKSFEPPNFKPRR